MTTLLFIHTAWVGGWTWDRVVRRLETLGHTCLVVGQLPSGGQDPARLGDLEADAGHVRALLDRAEEPVRVVAHSYGSMVAAEVADHPGVASLVHLAGVWPRTGESVLEIVGAEHGLVFYEAHDTRSLRVVRDVDLVRRALAGDMPEEEVVFSLPRTGLQSISSLVAPSRASPWQRRTTYVVCTEDAAVPARVQERMARRAGRVVRMASGHCPQLSRPDEVVEVILSTEDARGEPAPVRLP